MSCLLYPGQRLCIPSSVKLIEQKVIDLTNKLRQGLGLPVLVVNEQLARVARLKAEDMRDKDYVGHMSCTYGSPFDMIKTFGITFQKAAENAAAGQASPMEVVREWIEHPSHRENLLNSQVNQIGVGYAQGGTYCHYWSQMFID